MKSPFLKYVMFILTFISCRGTGKDKVHQELPSESPIDSDEVAIYRTSEFNQDITIKIDSVFNYHSVNENKGAVCCYEIGRIKKNQNGQVSIYLKVNGRDTAFVMRLHNRSKIMFGKGADKPFYIVTDENPAAFTID